jgi:TolB-like protein
VTDAVFCAAAIHQACSKTEGLQLRIGIHLGEVIFENNDVFGDGVNIASRLQALASPGSTWASEAVYKNLVNKKEISSEFVKEETLKNVSEPVKVYEITVKEIPGYLPDNIKAYQKQVRAVKPVKKKTIYVAAFTILTGLITAYLLFLNKQTNQTDVKKANTEKSIAVLPFRLISSDSGLVWLSDGFTEELTSSIAGISDLKVKSPTTMLQYKSSNKSIKQIGEELNVANVIDGSIQKEGNNIIINARLINPFTEEIIRNFPFRKDASEIKSIYSEVAQQVADVLNVTLTSEEKKRLQQTVKVDPEVYNLYLQGIYYIKRLSYEDALKAIGFFDKALEKDHDYAPALTGKAWGIFNQEWSGAITREKAVREVLPLLKKAISIDSTLSLAYSVYGWLSIINDWNLNEAEKQFLRAYQIDPGDDIAISGLMFTYLYGGNPKESQKWWETGKATSPKSWWIDAGYGMTLYFLGKTPEAIKHQKDCIEKYGHFLFYDKLGWIYSLTGQNKEAIELLEKELKDFNFRFPSSLAWLAVSYYNSGNKPKTQEILNEMEKMVIEKKMNVAVHLAAAYSYIGEKEKSLNMLDKAYQLKDMDMIWLKEYPHFKPIHIVARYQEMLKKVGF